MEWAVPLYGYVMPVIVTLTLATNSFIVVVLSHKYLRTPTNYVLLAMAVSELLTGLCVMPWLMYYFTLSGFKADVNYGLSSFWCNAVPYMAAVLPSIFHTTAIWLTVYLAIQRYVYICVPTLVRRFCTIHRSKQVIATICLASILMYVPDMLATGNISMVLTDYKTNGTPYNIFKTSISFNNILKKLTMKFLQNTRMLIVVIVLFLITEIPAALIFMTHVLSVSLKSYVIDYQLLNVLLIVR
uniref:G_PROTEIN_RECEP_F1_2 domain-containing protein n=1 Tax=Heterorhabditis bacteriophora TaxID=37862 RepID=A0A1I7WNM8_HETBA